MPQTLNIGGIGCARPVKRPSAPLQRRNALPFVPLLAPPSDPLGSRSGSIRPHFDGGGEQYVGPQPECRPELGYASTGMSEGFGQWLGSRQPVIRVSWEEAKSYVVWLKRTTGKDYRLLTESAPAGDG